MGGQADDRLGHHERAPRAVGVRASGLGRTSTSRSHIDRRRSTTRWSSKRSRGRRAPTARSPRRRSTSSRRRARRPPATDAAAADGRGRAAATARRRRSSTRISTPSRTRCAARPCSSASRHSCRSISTPPTGRLTDLAGALPLRPDAGRRPTRRCQGRGTRTIRRRRRGRGRAARRTPDRAPGLAGRRHVPASRTRRRCASTTPAAAHGQIVAFNNRTYDVTQAVPTVVMRNEDYGRIARILADGTPVDARSDDRQQDVSRKDERRTTPSPRSPAPTRRTRS